MRFAPSPTGYLHVGGARTALFNWLYARQHGGRFLLRIEDTDRERSTPEAVEAIFEGLRWLRIDWDAEPVFQSRRIEEHRRMVKGLLDVGAAYHCFCDPELLARQQKEVQKSQRVYRYPGTCRHLSPDEVSIRLASGASHAVRFKMPPGRTAFRDLVHGPIQVVNRELDDFILLRQDGTPVYQVAVVSDDIFMGITHVIRGDDHISNTPKQILLYEALGRPTPQFAHVPLILGPDKKRLSKRHGATSVMDYRNQGIYWAAMRNFLALLGWSPGDDREMLDQSELIRSFSLKAINSAGAVFDEAKLQWMNAKYISMLSDVELWSEVKPFVGDHCERAGIPRIEDHRGERLIRLFRERMKTFAEVPLLMEYFLRDPISWDEKGLSKHWLPETTYHLSRLNAVLRDLKDWTKDMIETTFDSVADEFGIERGRLIHPVRLALTGRTASPGIFEVMEFLGRETCLGRIARMMQARGA